MISLTVQILAYLEQLDNFVRQEAQDLPQILQEVLHFCHLEVHPTKQIVLIIQTSKWVEIIAIQ